MSLVLLSSSLSYSRTRNWGERNTVPLYTPLLMIAPLRLHAPLRLSASPAPQWHDDTFPMSEIIVYLEKYHIRPINSNNFVSY